MWGTEEAQSELYYWHGHIHVKDPGASGPGGMGQGLPYMNQIQDGKASFLWCQCEVECAKSSSCSFLRPDVYSLKLLACRDPLLRPVKSWPCPVHNRLVVPGSHVVVLPHQSSHSPAQLFCLCVCPFFAPSQPQSCFLAQAVLDQIGYRDVYTTC